ncbi:MAG: LysM peptidoglycan-binding domain-containing protein [Anaerolineae bacterium]
MQPTRIARMLILLAGLLIFAAPTAAQDQTIHIVQPGDNLYRIAQMYGTTVSALAEANDIAFTWHITTGQRLIIPVPAETTSAPNTLETAPADAAPAVEQAQSPADQVQPPAPAVYHTVAWGDSLGSIARRYGMTLDQLARLNDITNPDLIYVGQRLIISAGTTDTASTTTNDVGTAPGDAPALALDTVTENAAPAPLIPNYSVFIPPAFTNASSDAVTVGTTSHIVRYGESLSAIARSYGVSMLAITQANNIYDANTIYVGQELTIPITNAETVSTAGISIVPAAPAPTLSVGREIIVDLSDQRTYAYENGVLVRNVLVSTGLPNTPTVLGDFTIQRKYVAQTMTGPGYYLPDVPYILYFYAGYALHGTYWHSNFGHPMSHGCVNLPTPEAEWFYNWAEVGTPVHVQT